MAAVSLAASGWKTHCDFRGVKCEQKTALQVMKNTQVTEKMNLLWNCLKCLSESKQQ